MKALGRIVPLAGSLILAGVVVELCARLVARRSPLLTLTGLSAEAWQLVSIAAVAAIASHVGTRHVARRPIFLLLFAAGLAAQIQLGARLQSDGFYYFAYLRSLTFDGDVELSNDYRLLGLGDKAHLFEPTPTGYAQSAWTIGPAFVWSPFFAGGHAVAIWLNRTDPNVSLNGISFPYRQAVCVAGLFYALLGCWFCYRIAARFYPDRLAVTSTAIVMLGSFMIWYIVKEPSMYRVRRTLLMGALFTFCAAGGFLPQMIAWKSIYGSWLAVSPVGPQIRWWDPHLVDILFSARNGLFSWSPVLYLGAIGLVMFSWKRPTIGVPMITSVALMTYFNASVQDWWGSAGFGGRRFDGTIPMFVVGLSAFGAWAVETTRRHPWRIVAAAGALLVAWNLALVSAAQSGIVRIGESVSFGDTSAAQVRALHRWVGNPFTYPVSLAFAVRNRVPPSSYDLLSANRFLGDPLQPYGRIDIGLGDEWLIADGWHGAERSGDGTTFRWASSPALLRLPLDHAAHLVLQVRLHAFGFPGAAPQAVTLAVNGHELAAVPIGASWETVQIETGEDLWRAGVNRVRITFAWSARPVDVGLGDDSRELAAAVDYVRVVKGR